MLTYLFFFILFYNLPVIKEPVCQIFHVTLTCNLYFADVAEKLICTGNSSNLEVRFKLLTLGKEQFDRALKEYMKTSKLYMYK